MAGTEITKIGINSGESVGIAITIKEFGVFITPETVTWTLFDGNKRIVNDRLNISATPGNPTIITLDPADTETLTGDELRYLTVRSVYTSHIIPGHGGIEDSGDEVIYDEAGEAIEPEFSPAQCVSNRQWRIPVKHLKRAVLDII